MHRLEKKGWIKSEWGVTDNNQRAKFYGLTSSGRKQLASERSRWNAMTAAIGSLMNRSEGQA
jgi:PadR family transcriptional regulator, regulatory protein PadR